MEEIVKLLGINQQLSSYKILLVGAGGIGCELLKTLIFSGFTNITIIDLDTIEVSNLNRQFLFRPQHVGLSKAITAKISVESLYNQPTSIQAYCDDITSRTYDTEFYRSFKVVLCALDNIAARVHVNRMCMSTSVPFIDSGTAGYLGNVGLISKGETACYECVPKKAGRTYASCTIRNTPSKPIHCIVWAKYLFNQLFSREDQDEDIVPETAANSQEPANCITIRELARNCDYNSKDLFIKLFSTDINYLLSMSDLWRERKPPIPLDTFPPYDSLLNGNSHTIWTTNECARVFHTSLSALSKQFFREGDIVFDKDNDDSVDFVTACANLRCYVFSIERESKFTVKSLAGSIIPAIATTNAIIAGLVVIELIKYISNNNCKSVYLSRYPTSTGHLIIPASLPKPNPDCYACSEHQQVIVAADLSSVTVGFLRDKILKEGLGMVFPDVEVDDGTGTILISSDTQDDFDIGGELLSSFKIVDGTALRCDDFFQDFEIVVVLKHIAGIEGFHVVQGDEEEPHDGAIKRATSPVGGSEPKRVHK